MGESYTTRTFAVVIFGIVVIALLRISAVLSEFQDAVVARSRSQEFVVDEDHSGVMVVATPASSTGTVISLRKNLGFM
jgi:hypothetical protein